ncbi:hypothetical protein FFK22_016775 [Mycobacterium sp. KBS0706]|uniref:hypothetical protein n=1 Tax=Mycobacterium sp. KBS0706 TaxID=2578109 RepID=UPI00110F88DD|nr:hypothetical protein [Mycobacterium sp. KBS0706]TSD87497.1 hypothetical protein FFK22_016775 [Mycobacterium sp. KBS0706]
MKGPLSVAGLATVVALASGPAVAACKYVNDGEWRSGHSSAESSLNAGVDGLGAAVSQQQAINTQILTSIIAVLTKQKSLDGDQNATAARAAAQALAATSSEIMRRQALSETVESYGPAGQALDPCVTAEKGAQLGDGVTQLDARAGTLSQPGEIDSISPDARLGDATRARLEDWTAQQKAAVLLDASVPAEVKDRTISAIGGLPPPSASERGSGTVALAAAAVDAARLRALRGPLVRTLQTVRAAAEAELGKVSVIDSLAWVIARYGAGPQNQDWRLGLVTLGPRGLDQEEARLDAVLLDLARLESQLDELETATLATSLAATE